MWVSLVVGNRHHLQPLGLPLQNSGFGLLSSNSLAAHGVLHAFSTKASIFCSSVPCYRLLLRRKDSSFMMIFLGKARLFSLFLMSYYAVKFCIGGDVNTATDFIQDPGSITSSGGIYRMGFFSPNGSANRYVGIWYNNVPTYNFLWVANRENPILDSSGVVTVLDDGNLVVMNGKRELFWSSNVSNSVTDANALLLDSGNLVLLKQSSSATDAETFWESFQHMTVSFLGQMKFSTSSSTNEQQALTSWRSASDPSIGSFLASPDLQNIPDLFIWNGSSRYWRSGPIGLSDMQPVYIDGFNVVDNHEGTFYLNYSLDEVPRFSYLFFEIKWGVAGTILGSEKQRSEISMACRL